MYFFKNVIEIEPEDGDFAVLKLQRTALIGV